MATSTVRTCDQCGQTIAGKIVEVGGYVAIINGQRAAREITRNAELCGHACATSMFAGMLRDVEAAPASPDCHSIS